MTRNKISEVNLIGYLVFDKEIDLSIRNSAGETPLTIASFYDNHHFFCFNYIFKTRVNQFKNGVLDVDDIIDELIQSNVDSNIEIVFGFLANQYVNPSVGDITQLQLNVILTELCNMEVIFKLASTKKKWLAAYFTYMNNKPQQQVLLKRTHEPEKEHNVWGEKKSKTSVLFFSNNSNDDNHNENIARNNFSPK